MMNNLKYKNTQLLWLLVGFLLMFSSCLKEDINPASGEPNPYLSILDVRKIYKGTETSLNTENLQGSNKITGIVISDASAGNMPLGTFAIQQTRRGLKRGIEILVNGTPNIPLKFGDSVSVDVVGATINRNKGALQIQISSISKVAKNSENNAVEPTVVNLATFKVKFADYEGTLIKVANVDAVGAGNAFGGDVTVTEPNSTGILHTELTANFATKLVALNASYTGIARYDEDVQKLWPLNAASVEDESGVLYDGYPEDFESGDNTLVNGGSYATTKTGTLKTGNYTLTNFVLGSDINDLPTSGIYAARANQNSATNSWITMNYDLANGASKVTVWAGVTGTAGDLGSTWRLEYSQNQGATWSQVGADILTTSKVKKLFTFLMDIKGPVRFRIGKIGIGTSTTNNQNGRFNFDDLAIYKNPDAGGPVTNPVPQYDDLLLWQFFLPVSTGLEASFNSTTTNAGLTTAVLTRGTGLNPSGLAGGFGSNSAGPIIPATKAIAISQNVYFQVKFTVKPGSTLSLSAINVKLRRSGAGAKSHKWFYSLDDVNFNETIGTGDVNYEGADANGLDMPIYYLYQTPQLQNIPGGTTVTLRMYNWGFTNNGSGSFAIGRTLATTTPGLKIGGKITP